LHTFHSKTDREKRELQKLLSGKGSEGHGRHREFFQCHHRTPESVLYHSVYPMVRPLSSGGCSNKEGSLHHALETLERRMIRSALERAGFNQTQAARLLGLSERMLRYKLKKYGFK